MDYILELTDKSGRKIHLSKKQWAHIRKKHPEIEDFEILREGIEKFDKVKNYDYDSSVHHYYKFFKNRKPSQRFLCIAVKYLNGEGYIITAFFDVKIT